MRERFVGYVDQVGQRIEQRAIHIDHERLKRFVRAKQFHRGILSCWRGRAAQVLTASQYTRRI